MAKAKQRASSAAQRRQEVKKQRQQRLTPSSNTQSQARRSERGRGQSNQLPWGLLVGAVLVLVAVVGVIFYLSHQPSNSSTTAPTPTSASVLKDVTHVDPAVLAAVGTGGQDKLLTPLKGSNGSIPPPLTGPSGKPEIFYAGAEYCPYCAAERWAMVVALSRFGTFSKLDQTTSSASDVYPNTPTFTFYHSDYTSQYIDFVSLEETTNQQDSSGNYTVLQTPTADQEKLIQTYDAPPYLSSPGSIPFIDIAHKYAMQGANFSPDKLAGHSWDDIARQLSDKNSDITKAIVGSANYLTAAICIATKQQPASVCTVAPIPQIEQSLGKTGFNAGDTQSGFAFQQADMLARRQD